MWKAIVYKELRENLGLGLLALAVYLFMAASWIGVKLLPWSAEPRGSRSFRPRRLLCVFWMDGRALPLRSACGKR